MKTTIKPEGRFAVALATAMEDHNPRFSIHDLAVATGMTYEHIRKLVKGVAYPSKWALKEICSVLKLDYDAMQELAVSDRIVNKWGGIPHSLLGQHPELSLLSSYWDKLTDDQKNSMSIQIKALASSNNGYSRRAS